MKRYLVILEPTETGYSAYSPDVPGCAATGPSRAAAEANIREAIAFHFDRLRGEGHPVPEPRTEWSHVDVID